MRGVGNAFTSITGDAFNVNGNATVTASLTVGGVAAQAVALANPLLGILSALETALNAIAAATQPPTTPAVLAYQSAISGLKLALKSATLAAT